MTTYLSSIIDKINLINVISNNDENKYNHNNMYDQLINIQKNDSIRIYSNNIYNDRKQYKTIVKDLNRSCQNCQLIIKFKLYYHFG